MMVCSNRFSDFGIYPSSRTTLKQRRFNADLTSTLNQRCVPAGMAVKLFCLPLENNFTLKGKNLLTLGAKSFLLEKISFRRVLWLRKTNRKSRMPCHHENMPT